MSKYKKDTIYSGNLMKYTSGQSILVKENELIVYSEESDSFYTLADTLNPSLDLLNSHLTQEQKETAKNIINNHKYSYINNGKEGNLYIDEDTIKIAISKEDKKRK